MANTVPTVTGRRPRTRRVSWKQQVQQVVNLNAPRVEYRFSNGRVFIRNPNSTSGVYE